MADMSALLGRLRDSGTLTEYLDRSAKDPTLTITGEEARQFNEWTTETAVRMRDGLPARDPAEEELRGDFADYIERFQIIHDRTFGEETRRIERENRRRQPEELEL